jgi:pyridoxamine 5'-phosphate oxidase
MSSQHGESLSSMRTEYLRAELDEADAGTDPMALFGRWFDDAVRAGGRDPNAMTLATADAQGRPCARIVLCKEFDASGFVFYTNLESRKSGDLAANPQACALFFWPALERQVRIEGPVGPVSATEADAYFGERPMAARLGAWASPQSRPIASREVLAKRLADMQERFRDIPPPRPPHWGGYRLQARAIEFWQGRASRLHDRLQFLRVPGGWERNRLAP